MTETKEYLTLQEAAEQLGIKRASLYYYLKKMDIKRYDFPLNRHTYITQADFQRIKATKERPWEISGQAVEIMRKGGGMEGVVEANKPDSEGKH